MADLFPSMISVHIQDDQLVYHPSIANIFIKFVESYSRIIETGMSLNNYKIYYHQVCIATIGGQRI
jgi:hypothetical protein